MKSTLFVFALFLLSSFFVFALFFWSSLSMADETLDKAVGICQAEAQYYGLSTGQAEKIVFPNEFNLRGTPSAYFIEYSDDLKAGVYWKSGKKEALEVSCQINKKPLSASYVKINGNEITTVASVLNNAEYLMKQVDELEIMAENLKEKLLISAAPTSAGPPKTAAPVDSILASVSGKLTQDQVNYLEGVVDQGLLKLKAEDNYAYVDPDFWSQMHYDFKQTFSAACALYFAMKRNNDLVYVTMYDLYSGKQLAKFTEYWGFEAY